MDIGEHGEIQPEPLGATTEAVTNPELIPQETDPNTQSAPAYVVPGAPEGNVPSTTVTETEVNQTVTETPADVPSEPAESTDNSQS